jgi:rhodanese-related sulfurtransferase
MNNSIVYIIISLLIIVAYKKYTQNKMLKLLPSLLEEGGQIVDVRTKDEFVLASKDGSTNIPLESLQSRIKNKGDRLLLYIFSRSPSLIECR